MTTPRVTVPVEPTEAMRLVPDRVLTETLYWMARAYERVHSMPRVSDTELANKIEAAKADLGRARDASPILSNSAAPAPEGGAVKRACVDFQEAIDDFEAEVADVMAEGSERADLWDREITVNIDALKTVMRAALATREEAPADAGEAMDAGFEAWLNERNLLPHGAWDWPSIVAMLNHHEDALRARSSAPEAREPFDPDANDATVLAHLKSLREAREGEAVAKQWRAVDEQGPRTSWRELDWRSEAEVREWETSPHKVEYRALYTHPAHPSADHAELTRLAKAAGGEALGNLLAVIHGDGGHRALEVGTKQAALEAEKIVAGLLAAPAPEAPAEGAGERERLADAYIAGAMSVHEYWTENSGEAPRGDPEFDEAAGDYAYSILSDLRARSSAPEAREDYSSLIAARCVALPGKLIDCPVCLAVDNERARQAAPSADALRVAVEALEHYRCSCEAGHCAMSDDGTDTPVDDQLCGRRARQALSALQAEQKGGA